MLLLLILTSGCQGTRSATGKMIEFKKGAFSVAAKEGSSVVPITLDGTGRLMRNGAPPAARTAAAAPHASAQARRACSTRARWSSPCTRPFLLATRTLCVRQRRRRWSRRWSPGGGHKDLSIRFRRFRQVRRDHEPKFLLNTGGFPRQECFCILLRAAHWAPGALSGAHLLLQALEKVRWALGSTSQASSPLGAALRE